MHEPTVVVGVREQRRFRVPPTAKLEAAALTQRMEVIAARRREMSPGHQFLGANINFLAQL